MTNNYDPILIAGPPRSGSTMAAGLLIKHGVWVGEAYPTPYKNTNSNIGTENPDLKKLHFKYKNQMNYRNWQVPLPLQPNEDYGWFKQQVLSLVDTDGPWLVKTAWLVIFWSVWANAFPDAKWVLLDRPAEDIANSVIRHPKMKARGHETAYNFALALQERQKELAPYVNHIFIDTTKLGQGDMNEFHKLMNFCNIKPNENVAKDFIKPNRWGKSGTR